MFRAARAAGPIAGALALAIVATLGPSRVHAQPSDVSLTTSVQSPALIVDLPAASASDRQRVFAAARETIERYREWLGPSPESITIVSRGWRDAPPSPSSITLDVPWRSAPQTMDLESQVAFGIARQYWPALLTSPEAATVVNGLAWYLQSRVVERLFDFNYLVPGHSAAGVRFFGGAWPWTFPILPMGRSSSGLGREEYLRSRLNTPMGPPPARRLPPDVNPAVFRSALAFATLERHVGWPTLQGAIRVVTETAGRRSLSRVDLENILAAAVAQDLSWFFATAFETAKSLDYAVRDLTTGEASPCVSQPCFRTRVTVVRHGTGEFSGSSSAPSALFGAGEAMNLQVRFADGQRVSTRWDGRSPSRTFEFESNSPAESAAVDPDHVLLLDENTLNNEVRREPFDFAQDKPFDSSFDRGRLAQDKPRRDVAIRKWVAYWMVWLQQATLSFSALL